MAANPPCLLQSQAPGIRFPMAAPCVLLLPAADFALFLCCICACLAQLQRGPHSLQQLRTPRSAPESAEWGASGRAATAPPDAGVVGRPPLPTEVAQLQGQVARLQSQLAAMVRLVQAQSALWAHNLMGS